jgi:ribosomal protein S18 acetylase RimI-like enzyme
MGTVRHDRRMTAWIIEDLSGIDWERLKSDLVSDDFDNGRSASALRRSFEQSAFVAMALDGDRCVGTARLLSDGVCNAYLVDAWTASTHRRRGIAREMVERLARRVPGQHIGMQVDPGGAVHFYERLGFSPQPDFM